MYWAIIPAINDITRTISNYVIDIIIDIWKLPSDNKNVAKFKRVFYKYKINSLRPSDAYMRQ